MSARPSKVNKQALVNTLLHAEVQNRMQEEQEMWKKHKNMKTTDESTSKNFDRKHHGKKRKRERTKETQPRSSNAVCSVSKISNTSPMERWGHDGFMELHPEEVIAGNCFSRSEMNKKDEFLNQSDSSTSEERPKKKRKKKHSKRKKHESKNA